MVFFIVKAAKYVGIPNESLALQARFGATIKVHRLRLGVTQEELAWRADLHRSYLADIERGGRNVTLSSIFNLAHALQITLTDLLSHSVDVGIVGPYQDTGTELGEILLVEDSLSDIEMTLRAFKRANFVNPIKVVRDGKAALDYLFRAGRFAKRRAVMPQLVLLDLNLPKISGLDVLRQIKANKLTQSIPVVVLTGSPQDSTIIQCGKLGTENYLIKPVSFENFSKVTPHVGSELDSRASLTSNHSTQKSDPAITFLHFRYGALRMIPNNAGLVEQ